MSPAERLQALIDAGAFEWSRDQQTLMDAVREMRRLAAVCHTLNLANIELMKLVRI